MEYENKLTSVIIRSRGIKMTSLSASKPTKEVFMTISQKECSFAGCEKPKKGRGLCKTHWWQWRYKGVLAPVRQPKYVCSIDGCDKPHKSYGYCITHSNNWRRRGDPLKEGSHRWHGLTKTPEYKSWQSMKSRCNNPNSDKYKWYAGRGIKIDSRWLGKDGFENFLSDMGNRPEGTTLDRIDNDKGYEPGNCRWATKYEQMNNQSTNRKVSWDGKEWGVAELARHCGATSNFGKYYTRLNLGWSVEKTFGLDSVEVEV